MTPSERRLATLAAVLAPERARVVLALVAGPGARGLAAHAAGLLAAPRDQRLRALEDALQGPSPAERRARAEALAADERPGVAAAVLAAGRGAAPERPVTALLARLLRERLAG